MGKLPAAVWAALRKTVLDTLLDMMTLDRRSLRYQGRSRQKPKLPRHARGGDRVAKVRRVHVPAGGDTDDPSAPYGTDSVLETFFSTAVGDRDGCRAPPRKYPFDALQPPSPIS